jgi:hypothetical protein
MGWSMSAEMARVTASTSAFTKLSVTGAPWRMRGTDVSGCGARGAAAAVGAGAGKRLAAMQAAYSRTEVGEGLRMVIRSK